MTMRSLGDASGQTGGRRTSNRVGATTTSPSLVPRQTRTSLRTKRKASTESVSSNVSNTSASRSSSSYVLEKEASNKRARKSQKNKKTFVPTENHMKLRRVEEAGEKWESELQSIHGFTDGECCIIMGIIATHINKKTKVFPDANGDRYVQHAKEGWEYQKEFNRLIKLYPECLADQKRVNGKWVRR